jgi:hypothetical protein
MLIFKENKMTNKIRNKIKQNIIGKIFTTFPTVSLFENDNAFDVYVNSDDLAHEFVLCEQYENLGIDEARDILNEMLEDLTSMVKEIILDCIDKRYQVKCWVDEDHREMGESDILDEYDELNDAIYAADNLYNNSSIACIEVQDLLNDNETLHHRAID